MHCSPYCGLQCLLQQNYKISIWTSNILGPLSLRVLPRCFSFLFFSVFVPANIIIISLSNDVKGGAREVGEGGGAQVAVTVRMIFTSLQLVICIYEYITCDNKSLGQHVQIDFVSQCCGSGSALIPIIAGKHRSERSDPDPHQMKGRIRIRNTVVIDVMQMVSHQFFRTQYRHRYVLVQIQVLKFVSRIQVFTLNLRQVRNVDILDLYFIHKRFHSVDLRQKDSREGDGYVKDIRKVKKYAFGRIRIPNFS